MSLKTPLQNNNYLSSLPSPDLFPVDLWLKAKKNLIHSAVSHLQKTPRHSEKTYRGQGSHLHSVARLLLSDWGSWQSLVSPVEKTIYGQIRRSFSNYFMSFWKNKYEVIPLQALSHQGAHIKTVIYVDDHIKVNHKGKKMKMFMYYLNINLVVLTQRRSGYFCFFCEEAFIVFSEQSSWCDSWSLQVSVQSQRVGYIWKKWQ